MDFIRKKFHQSFNKSIEPIQIKRTKVFSLEAMPSIQPYVFLTQKGWIVIGFFLSQQNEIIFK
jgi:hypothetical protein